MEIYTIGHSNRSFEEFLSLLRSWKIKNLVDVRTAPSSRYRPHFNRTNLEAELPKVGVQYIWLKELGGFRRSTLTKSPNLGLRSPGFQAFADYMLTDEFSQAVAELLKIAKSERTAIMCAEALYFRCHRKLISDWLVAKGISVFHIFAEDEVVEHSLPSYARVREGKITYPPAGI